MKYLSNTSFFVLLMTAALTSCAPKTTTQKIYTTVTNPSTGGTGTVTDPGTGNSTTCSDGVYRSGATSCYYSNLPRLVFSGKGTYGSTLWSSSTGLPSNISPNQFRTDASFAVRIKPTYSLANETSRQGRICSGYTNTNFTKLKVYVMFRRTIDSIGEVKELTATVNSYSNTGRFSVPGGTTQPYILEVIGVSSDHRCNTVYGSLSASDRAACTAGTKFFDIPLVTASSSTTPTECIAFSMDFATDNTYDLPN